MLSSQKAQFSTQPSSQRPQGFQQYGTPTFPPERCHLKLDPGKLRIPGESASELLSRENLAHTRKVSTHHAWHSAVLTALQSCTHHKARHLYPINSGKDTCYLPRRQKAFAKDRLRHALEYLSQSRTSSFLPAVLIHMLFWDFRNVDWDQGRFAIYILANSNHSLE